MTATCIPYTQVPHSSALLTDYLYHFDRVSHFYTGSPYDPRSYQAVAAQLNKSAIPRTAIAAVLERQNCEFGCSEPTLTNIRRLREPGTFAVVTGQQVGLFSGPAFTVYKALTTVRLAQSLSEQGFPCVPVFWLATEDHDLEEVSQGASLDDEYNLVPLRDSGDRPSLRSPVGEVRHTDEISAALIQMEAALPQGEARSRLLQDLRECYVPGATWGKSFARFMTRLFGRWGVILMDPLDEAVHRLSSGVYQQAIGKAAELRAGVMASSRALVQRGYHAQVHVVEESTLVFVARHGDRLALHQRDGKFFLEGSEEVSVSELQSLLAERPLDFSPNVLLRPLVQDSLLPTLAYVAGPSELAYWGQARSLYSDLARPQPVVSQSPPVRSPSEISAVSERSPEQASVTNRVRPGRWITLPASWTGTWRDASNAAPSSEALNWSGRASEPSTTAGRGIERATSAMGSHQRRSWAVPRK